LRFLLYFIISIAARNVNSQTVLPSFSGIHYKKSTGTGGTDISDVEKAEGYLAHKWGLTGNLPVTHPYKSSAPSN
tara:strand:- start:530 stop:754 length:225 start_codon:yes stop_codon:yes gene_type:complete